MEIDVTEVEVLTATRRLIQANRDGAHPLVRYLLMQDLAKALGQDEQPEPAAMVLQLAALVRDHITELEQARFDALSWWAKRRHRKTVQAEPTHQADAAWYRAMS